MAARRLLVLAALLGLLATCTAGRRLHQEVPDPDAGQETDGDIVGDHPPPDGGDYAACGDGMVLLDGDCIPCYAHESDGRTDDGAYEVLTNDIYYTRTFNMVKEDSHTDCCMHCSRHSYCLGWSWRSGTVQKCKLFTGLKNVQCSWKDNYYNGNEPIYMKTSSC